MKIRNLFILLTFALLTASCENEDNDVIKDNYLKIGETEYVLSKGALVNYGQYRDVMDDYQYDGYNQNFVLVSEGLNIYQDDADDIGFSGSGQYIGFDIFSSKGDGLDNGDYCIDNSSTTFPIGTFDYGVYIINYSHEEAAADEWIEISSGKLTISNSENEYEININCTDENGKSVSGFFKGSLQYFNFDPTNK